MAGEGHFTLGSRQMGRNPRVKGASPMSTHGKISLWMADHAFDYRATKAKVRSGPLISTGNGLSGFRHFFKDPTPAQQFTIDGVTFDPDKQKDRANSLMKRLADII